MEAAIRNLVKKRVLVLACGAFSERWHQIALSCGKESDQLAVEWGRANRPEELERALATGRYDAVTITHNETSTGAINPLAELAAVARQHDDVIVLVDAVSSLGGSRRSTSTRTASTSCSPDAEVPRGAAGHHRLRALAARARPRGAR